jgi:hypothetical protein
LAVLEIGPLIGSLGQNHSVGSSDWDSQWVSASEGRLLRDSGNFSIVNVDGVEEAGDGLDGDPFAPVPCLEAAVMWTPGTQE